MPNESRSRKRYGIFMDEAISKTKFGIFNHIVIVMSGIILISVVLETCSIAFIMPVTHCDLNFTTSEKGVLSAISFFGIICSSHFFGFLADTKGRRQIMLPTLLATFIFSCCSSLCQNFYILVAFRFLNGFCISGPAAAVYAYLSEFHDNRTRGRAIMGSSIIFGISCLFLPIIAWLVINQEWQFDIPFIGITYKPWRLFFVICSLPGLLAYFILLFLPETPKFVLGQGDKSGAYEILRKMHQMNTGKKGEFEVFDIYEELESVENRNRMMESKKSRFPFLKSVWIQTAPLFQPPYLFSTILVCTIQFGIYATSNGFYMFFADILNRMATNLDSFTEPRISMCEAINMKSMDQTVLQHSNDTVTSEKMCVTKLELETLEQGIFLEVIYALGFVVISFVINRLGKFVILFFILVVSGSGGIACTLFNIPLAQIYSFIALMCCGMAANVTNAATVDIYPTSSRAMAVCITLMFGRLGCITGAVTAAFLLDNHCEMVFYLSGSTLMVIAVLTFFIPNIHNKVKTNEIVAPVEQRPSILSLR